ncbi:hypothetical protein H5410_024373 [Solanum commersonii]|uniref:Uncharacterized protein n=1 Tax=Solanum commersonii TaxID=4109 RepID=A0A9J5ZLT8_SOLCO|nr:hypothetical protein H5410_024373 [Solanum commersonii]
MPLLCFTAVYLVGLCCHRQMLLLGLWHLMRNQSFWVSRTPSTSLEARANPSPTLRCHLFHPTVLFGKSSLPLRGMDTAYTSPSPDPLVGFHWELSFKSIISSLQTKRLLNKHDYIYRKEYMQLGVQN